MFSIDRRRRANTRLELVRGLTAGTLESRSRPSFWGSGWSRIMVVVCAGVAVTAVLNFGGPVFPFRLGQTTDREIRLATSLQIENVTETRNARERAAREAPWVFSHQPLPVQTVVRNFSELAEAIHRSASVEDLSARLVAEWGMTPELFNSLSQQVREEDSLERFQNSIRRVFDPFVRYGLLGSANIPTDTKRETTLIEVRPVGTNVKYLPKLDAVFLPLLPQEGGALTKTLRTEFGDKLAVDILKLVVPKLQPTLTYDEEASRLAQRQAMENVEPVVDEYTAGALVVPAGAAIGPEQLRLLEDEYEQLMDERTWTSSAVYRRLVGLALMVGAIAGIVSIFLVVMESKIVGSMRQVLLLSSGFIATLVIARLFSIDPYRVEIVPVAVTAFYVAISHSRQTAVVLTMALSVLLAVIHTNPLSEFAVLAGGSAVGVLLCDSIRSRTKPILVGLATGGAAAMLHLGLGLLHDQSLSLVALDALRFFGGGLVAGFVMSGTLPFMESIFGIVTDISLLELGDSSHPLLQDLIRRAPGTYNHSVSVSIIAEAAAKAIGCNSLIVRVGAMFHDVGKMLKPQYFIENKGSDEVNRHDQLAPAISTLIIIGHVKDGMELAREHHLPRVLMDMIEQHHGTTLVDYFFHEATRELQSKQDPEEDIDESAFRYPGPKPQTKEAAVMMLADCCESASRALSGPTPARIEKLVHNLALNRLLDGQFDECGITLEELGVIERSLKKTLTAAYHGRIKYPAAG